MLISGSLNPKYLNTKPDIWYYTPSGALALNDNAPGGPISGINEGYHSYTMIGSVSYSGIEGASLQALQNQFPTYTRISWDKTSVGAQLLNSVAPAIDEFLQEVTFFNRSLYLGNYPVARPGTSYEWDFNTLSAINNLPNAEALINGQWAKLPIVIGQKNFFEHPPTRFEATTSQVSGLELLGWTKVNSAGRVILPISGYLPLYTNLFIEISGAGYFDITRSNEISDNFLQSFSSYKIIGDSLFSDEKADYAIEEGSFIANGVIATSTPWKYINQFELFNMDPNAYVRVKLFNFNRRILFDGVRQNWTFDRDTTPGPDVWQLCHGNTRLGDLVQHEVRPTITLTSGIYLARCALIRDTFSDADFEYNVLDTWQINKTDGTPLSGIVDFSYIPSTKYIALLDNQSNLWIVDTFKPAINMTNFQETRQAPVRIHLEYPTSSEDTPKTFSINLYPANVDTSDGISRYRWLVHHHNSIYVLSLSGIESNYTPDGGWQYLNDLTVNLQGLNYQISGAGQYVFELQMLQDRGIISRTFAGMQSIQKNALGKIPLYGLASHPSGLAFDGWSRLWVSDGVWAARFVSRFDVAAWIPAQRVLLTRENYDAVKSESITQTASSPRNIFTKIDDLGFQRDVTRELGETVAQFKFKMLSSAERRKSSTVNGLTNAISTEFGLASISMINLTTDQDYKIWVDQAKIYLSGLNYYTFNLIEKDLDGDWYFPTVNQIVSGLNNCSGIVANYTPTASGLPAFLLEPQSSYKMIYDERVLPAKTMQLGLYSNIKFNHYKIITDLVEFNDPVTFATKVNNNITRLGEWTVSSNGTVNAFTTPQSPLLVSYQYNVFTSGQTINLYGNGSKVISLANSDIESLLFDENGETAFMKDIKNGILSADRLFWGK